MISTVFHLRFKQVALGQLDDADEFAEASGSREPILAHPPGGGAAAHDAGPGDRLGVLIDTHKAVEWPCESYGALRDWR